MRRPYPLLFALAVVAGAASAQTPADKPAAVDPKPPVVEPLDNDIEPQVTIRQRDGATVEEYRVNGRLYKIRVTPTRGAPYILVDPTGEGSFVRQEGPGTPGLSVPQWVIGTF